jgi:hypothetical protein
MLCVDATPPSSRMTIRSHQAREIVNPVFETWLISVILDSLDSLRDAQRTGCCHLADVLIARRAARAERRLLTDARQAWPDDSRFAPPDRSEQEMDDLLVTVFREEIEDSYAAPSMVGGSPSTRFLGPSGSQATEVISDATWHDQSRPSGRVAAVAFPPSAAVALVPGIGFLGGTSALPLRSAEPLGRKGDLTLRSTWRLVLLSGLLCGAVAFGAAVRDLPWTHSSRKAQPPRGSASLSTAASSDAQRAASKIKPTAADHRSRHVPKPGASREALAEPARPVLAVEPATQRPGVPSGKDEPVTSQGGVTASSPPEEHAETAPAEHAATGNGTTGAESQSSTVSSSNTAGGSSTANVGTVVGNTGGLSAGGAEQAAGG